MKSTYRYFLSIPTRWKDNDIFGHINNVEYYSFVDTIIPTLLLRQGAFDIHGAPTPPLSPPPPCPFPPPTPLPQPPPPPHPPPPLPPPPPPHPPPLLPP